MSRELNSLFEGEVLFFYVFVNNAFVFLKISVLYIYMIYIMYTYILFFLQVCPTKIRVEIEHFIPIWYFYYCKPKEKFLPALNILAS